MSEKGDVTWMGGCEEGGERDASRVIGRCQLYTSLLF